MNTFSGTGAKLTDSDLLEAGRAIGIEIPEAIKKHYLQHNGGVPSLPCWPLESGEYLEISAFLPIRTAHSGSRTMESVLAVARAKDILLGNLVPFASDWGGNYFCFDSHGRIYFYSLDDWSAEMSMEENKKNAARLLANDFDSFFERLEEAV